MLAQNSTGLSAVNKALINVDQLLQDDKMSIRIDFKFEVYRRTWIVFKLTCDMHMYYSCTHAHESLSYIQRNKHTKMFNCMQFTQLTVVLLVFTASRCMLLSTCSVQFHLGEST